MCYVEVLLPVLKSCLGLMTGCMQGATEVNESSHVG